MTIDKDLNILGHTQPFMYIIFGSIIRISQKQKAIGPLNDEGNGAQFIKYGEKTY